MFLYFFGNILSVGFLKLFLFCVRVQSFVQGLKFKVFMKKDSMYIKILYL